MLLAFLLQAAAPLPAGQPVPGPRPQPAATVMAEPIALALAGWDADGDGRTSRAEMTAAVGRSFAALDGATSGKVGYIAFADWAERWLGDRAALPSPFEVDADGDDRITLPELAAAMGRIFDRLDRDRDGMLSRAEMLTIRPGLRDLDDRRKKKRRGGGTEQPPGQ